MHSPRCQVKQANPRQSERHLLSAACAEAPIKVRCKCSIAVESGTERGSLLETPPNGLKLQPSLCKGFGREGKRREPHKWDNTAGALEPKWYVCVHIPRLIGTVLLKSKAPYFIRKRGNKSEHINV